MKDHVVLIKVDDEITGIYGPMTEKECDCWVRQEQSYWEHTDRSSVIYHITSLMNPLTESPSASHQLHLETITNELRSR